MLILKLGSDLFVKLPVFYVRQGRNIKVGVFGHFHQLFTLGSSNLVGGFLQARPNRTSVEHNNAKIDSLSAERNIIDAAVFRIIMSAHAFAGEKYHNLVELAAGRTDIIIFNRLGPVDNLQPIFDFNTIGVKQR